jgi:hypothetical protein
VPFCSGSIMVWGGVCLGGRTDLYICQRTMNGNTYANDVVNGILPNFQATIGPHFIYIDDNARPHRTRNVIIALENHGIQHLALPPRSPDLNPIIYSTCGMLLETLCTIICHPQKLHVT